MPTDTREERLARRIDDLLATDPEFAAAVPDDTIAETLDRPELRLPDIIATALDGYAERPALGQRAVDLVTDPQTGRTEAKLLPASTPSPTPTCPPASTSCSPH